MSGYRGSAALAIPLDSTGDVTDSKKIAWRYGRGTPYVPSPLLYQGRLYFTQMNDALLTVLDARTGKALTDRQRLKGVSSFYASPVGAAGRVYFVGRDGSAVVLKAGDKPEVLAVNKLDDPIDASPAVVGKQMFLRGEGHLYCLEAN
jgi:outer membrane protein assembly factor BamB